ncbi:MAG: Uma2 family endonuclease, partial [Acidimicrobiales bacterium]
RARRLVGTPLLVVEIQSPSTRLIDLNLKRAAYATAGVPSYWLVDPEVPSVTVLDLDGNAYAETARAAGDAVLQVIRPFPVTIVPRDLLQGLDA